MSARTKPTSEGTTTKPLIVTLLNSSGKPIDVVVMAGELPKEDPILLLAQELGGKYKNIKPTPVSK